MMWGSQESWHHKWTSATFTVADSSQKPDGIVCKNWCLQYATMEIPNDRFEIRQKWEIVYKQPLRNHFQLLISTKNP